MRVRAYFLLGMCAHLFVAPTTVLPEREDTRMYYTKQLAALRMEAFDRLQRPRESSSPFFHSSHSPALSRAELGKSGRHSRHSRHGQDGPWPHQHAQGEGARDRGSEGIGSEEGFADTFDGRFDEPALVYAWEQEQAEFADERRLSQGSVVHESSVEHPTQCERADCDSSVENALLQGTDAEKENRDTRASGEIEPLQPYHTQDLSQVVKLDSKDL